jgi:hypothetical protein
MMDLEEKKNQLRNLIDRITSEDLVYIFTESGPRVDGSEYTNVKVLIEKGAKNSISPPIFPNTIFDSDGDM